MSWLEVSQGQRGFVRSLTWVMDGFRLSKGVAATGLQRTPTLV